MSYEMPMETLIKDGYMYDVFIDHEGNEEAIAGNLFSFGDYEADRAYSKRFKDGELCAYTVIKTELCKCCNRQGEVIDSLNGIHAESVQEALTDYLRDHNTSDGSRVEA